MRKLLFMVTAVSCAFFCCSCRKLGPSSAGTMVESYQSTKITENSKMFGDWFEIVEHAAAKRDNGLLTATVSLQNLKGDCQFEYRFRWLDKNGIEVRSPITIWMQKSSASKEVSLLSATAPTKKVEDFILDIRFVYGSERWNK